MAVVDSEAVLGTDASSLLQQLGSTFLKLQAHNDASEDKVHWVEIEQHFQNLEADLKKKSEDLEVREKEFEEKKSETCISLAGREAVVLTKEQGSYDRIQELKDAAVAAITEARANYKPAKLEPVDDGDNKESEEAKTNPQGKDEDITNAGGGAQDHENAQELTALRAVIRCAQDCKLESEYPLGPLRKRIAELEKAKADKRRGGDHGKQHNRKKARANGGFYGFRGPSIAAPGRQVPVYGNRGSYMGMPERYSHAPPPPNSYNYHITNPPPYAQQVNEQRVNYYGQEERVSATPYDAAAPNYGSYASSAMQPPHQPYM